MKKEAKQSKPKWITFKKNVDIDTGEIISEQEMKNYYIIKTKKYVRQYNRNSPRRYIEITNVSRKRDYIQSTIW